MANEKRMTQETGDSVEVQGQPSARTILLVDDDLMVREVGRLMLVNLGFSVVAAADGVEAVELFGTRKEEFSLVFCDQVMPGMDGWQTMVALREINPDIPVIMISGGGLNAATALSRTSQPQAFLSKPYRMETMRQTIELVLNMEKPTV